jgi:hypothetical protein
MRISQAFPSKYLKSSDLNGQEVRVTIASVVMERISEKEDPKPVMYFQGKTKGMVLNKTNSAKIANNYGDNTDDWVGCEILLFEDEVTFNNQQVPALRVRIPRGKPMQRRAEPTEDHENPGHGMDDKSDPDQTDFRRKMDQDIPF